MRPLLHIGYQKTGTNWLQRLFFSDPETGYHWIGKRPGSHPVRRFVRDGPFEFDAAAVREALAPYVQEALDGGRVPVVSFERLSGHPHSGGFDSRQIADRLHEVFPEGRVLVVAREQRSMVRSIYKGYVENGGAARFKDFVDPPRSRAVRIPLFDARHFEYDRLIEYYRRLFGPENVLPLTLDQFATDGRAFVERIAAFAERPVAPEVLDRLPYTRRENVRAVSALTIDVTRHLNLVGPRSELNPSPFVRSRRLGKLAHRLQQADALNGKLTRRLVDRREDELRRAVDAWAGERFVESNRRLQELVGVDLGAFGWRT